MKREKISLVKAVTAVVTGIILFLILTAINKTGSEAFFKAYAAETVSTLELSIIPEEDGLFQHHVIDNELKKMAITEDECNNGGISKKEFVNRLNDNINN